jgi:hypothetical protein
MRLLAGLILGCALTVGGAFVADSLNAGKAGARPMVNWEVVGENVQVLVGLAKDGWKKISG